VFLDSTLSHCGLQRDQAIAYSVLSERLLALAEDKTIRTEDGPHNSTVFNRIDIESFSQG